MKPRVRRDLPFHELIGVEGVYGDPAVANGRIKPGFGGMKGSSGWIIVFGVDGAEFAECFPVARSQSLTGSSQFG